MQNLNYISYTLSRSNLITILAISVVGLFLGASVALAGGGGSGSDSSGDDKSGSSNTYNADGQTSGDGWYGSGTTVTGYSDGGSTKTVMTSCGSNCTEYTTYSTDGTSYTRTETSDDGSSTSYTPRPPAQDSCAYSQYKYDQCISQGWDRMGEMYRSCGRSRPVCTAQTPSCSADPDLRTGALSITSAASDLQPGVPFTVSAPVTNESCRTSSHNYTTQSPFATIPGAFPIRLQIDLNNDDTPDDFQYRNNQGPLTGGASLTAAFDNIVLPQGTHRLSIYADIPGPEDPNSNGCNRPEGCISESGSDNNEQSILVTVANPSITLGSYLIPERANVNEQSRPVEQFSTANSRDITDFTGDVGLYWDGDDINLNTCVGNGPGFSGQPTEPNYAATYAYGYPNNDAVIEEPAVGDTYTYTIRCDTPSGGTVTDEIQITNGGVVTTPTVAVRARLLDTSTISLATTDTLTSESLTLENTGDADAVDTSYTLTIDDNPQISDSGIIIPAGDTAGPFTPTFTWSPSGTGTFTLEVCAEHPEDTRPASSRCDSRLIEVQDTQSECSDGINNDPSEDNATDAADPGCHNDGDPNDPGDPNVTGNPNDPNCPSATCSYDPNDNDETDEPLCSNGGDDDGDVLADAADPGCHTDGDPDTNYPGNPNDPNCPSATCTYDPDRNTERDAPTIRVVDQTGTPVSVVRQGTEVTLEWDTNGNSGCTLSTNLNTPDAYSANTTIVEARRTTDYSIDCDFFEPISVRLQVIPVLFET